MTRRDALLSFASSFGVVPLAVRTPREGPAVPVEAALAVRVEDEFGLLKSAIVHDASNAVDLDMLDLLDGLALARERGRSHPETGPISRERVIREVAKFRDLLGEFGVELLQPRPVEGVPSQVFTRDPCFAVGDRLFVGRLLDDHRVAEVDGLAEIRARVPDAIDLGGHEVFVEGGDVIVLGPDRPVLVGTNWNTNEKGFAALAGHLRRSGATVQRVRHRRLHLDCCLAPLPDGSALVAPGVIAKRDYPLLKATFRTLIPLDAREASRYLAANILWLDRETVVSAVQCRKTNALLRSMGYEVRALDFGTVKRMWGSFRCAACPIRRD